jgi:hypothetical protein
MLIRFLNPLLSSPSLGEEPVHLDEDSFPLSYQGKGAQFYGDLTVYVPSTTAEELPEL